MSDRFVVVVHDPVTGETDACGPMSESGALLDVRRRRHEMEAEGLGEVFVIMVGLHVPP